MEVKDLKNYFNTNSNMINKLLNIFVSSDININILFGEYNILHLAIMKSDLFMVTALLFHGANPNALTYSGISPFKLSLYSKINDINLEIIKQLIRYGSKYEKINYNSIILKSIFSGKIKKPYFFTKQIYIYKNESKI